MIYKDIISTENLLNSWSEFVRGKKNKKDDVDIVSLVKEGNPEATDHKCPYCSVVHEFKASRARKCPDCSKKMIVRQGLFITEDQAKKLEKKI